jgi:hypothetical protein
MIATIKHQECAVVYSRRPGSSTGIDDETNNKEETRISDASSPNPPQNDDKGCASSCTDSTEDVSESSYASCSEEGDPLDLSVLPSTIQSSQSSNDPPQNLLDIQEGGLQEGIEESSSASTTTIRFAAEMVEYRDVLHRRDYSQDEKSACWHTASEFSRVQRQAQALIELLECGQEIPAGMSATLPSRRGLENYMTRGARSANLHYTAARNAVLSEQREQRLAGKAYDEMAIAKKYRTLTLRCRFPARKMALQDQQDASR